MPPRAGSSRSTSSPARSRLHPGPKSTRIQFSACGACRIRRVKCDLKDLPPPPRGQVAACTNCSSRSIQCVDEYAAVKTFKARNGRRLAQVVQVYGRSDKNPMQGPPSPTHSSPGSSRTNRPSIIPDLDKQFFASSFFSAFNLQHSLLDPHDFASRYIAHVKGTSLLPVEGQLLAKVLVIWAASFGVDHTGTDVPTAKSASPDPAASASPELDTIWDQRQDGEHPDLVARRQRTDAQVQELLNLIDIHGILRKPTWDGARLLLLIWPLTQGVQSQLQRITMYESTMSQIYALCCMECPTSVNSGQGLYADAMLRARMFWHAHVHEGTTNGLRGTRLALNDVDLGVFQATLPQRVDSGSSASASSSLPSPISPSHPNRDMPRSPQEQASSQSTHAYTLTVHYFAPMLKLSAVCRRIHSILTGPKARRNVGCLDEAGLRDIWEGLERSWDEFEVARTKGLGPSAFTIGSDNLDRFVSSWQIYIFECHNVIRKELKQRVISSPVSSQKAYGSGSPGSASSSSSPSGADAILHLYAHASRKCRALLPRVLCLLQRHLSPNAGVHRFFAYDVGLVKGGCYFAGSMLAQGDLDHNRNRLELELGMDVESGIQICLQALESMTWIYSKSRELQTEIRELRGHTKQPEVDWNRVKRPSYTSHSLGYQQTSPQYSSQYASTSYTAQPKGAPTLPYPLATSSRPPLPPVITTGLTEATAGTSYGPATNWGMYTPPSTAHTHRSSPDMLDEYATMSNMAYCANDSSDPFYYSVPARIESGTASAMYDFGGISPPGPLPLTSFVAQPSDFLDDVFSNVSMSHEHSPTHVNSPPFEGFYSS